MNEYWFIYEPKPKWVRELLEEGLLEGPGATPVSQYYIYYAGACEYYIYDSDALLRTSEGIICPVSFNWIDRAKNKNPNIRLYSPIEGETENILTSIYSNLDKNE